MTDHPAEPRQGMLTAEEVATLNNEHSEVYLAPEYRMHCAKCDVPQPCDAARLLDQLTAAEAARREAERQTKITEECWEITALERDKERLRADELSVEVQKAQIEAWEAKRAKAATEADAARYAEMVRLGISLRFALYPDGSGFCNQCETYHSADAPVDEWHQDYCAVGRMQAALAAAAPEKVK